MEKDLKTKAVSSSGNLPIISSMRLAVTSSRCNRCRMTQGTMTYHTPNHPRPSSFTRFKDNTMLKGSKSRECSLLRESFDSTPNTWSAPPIAWCLRVFVLLALMHLASSNPASKVINVGVILPTAQQKTNLSHIQFKMEETLPAIMIALEKLQKNPTFIPGYTFNVMAEDSNCDDLSGPLAAVDMYYGDHKPHVFFGPGCKFALAPVARFAHIWNIPTLSAAAMLSSFDNKTEFFLTRLFGGYSQLDRVFASLTNQFNFDNVSVIYSEFVDPLDSVDVKDGCLRQIAPVHSYYKQRRNKPPVYERLDAEVRSVNFGAVLQKLSNSSRCK